jgi:hypothetical protein
MKQLLPQATIEAIAGALTYEEKWLLRELARGGRQHLDRIPERVLIATGLAESNWDGELGCWILSLTTLGALAAPSIAIPVSISIEART